MNKHSWLRLAWSIACVAILGHTPCRAESDLDLLKRQTREFEWAPINPDKPALSQAGPWAKALRSDGSWPDVNYTDQSPGFWKTTEHLKRTLSMATLFASRQAAGKKDPPLKAPILAALHYWISHDFHNPNWWQNEIAVPRYTATILLLMGDDISAPDKQAALRIAARAAISMTGQNRVWKSGIVFRRALVEGNLDLARQARDAILGELKVTTAEGLQIDDSFHQHGPQQQMGNYGLGFAGDMAAWGLIWRGTTLAIPEEKLALLRGYILNGEALVTANGMMDISACGRQLFVGSAGAKGRGVLRLLAAMEQVDPGTALRYRAAAVQDSQPVGSGLPTLPGAVMNKDFFRSDYMVHRRPAFYASVKLCSLRVIGGELVNAENISGRYLADGALFLYQTGREYADIFPVWDWRRVPGVTCVTTGTTLRPAGLMATDFAGGVSDGTYGAAGLDCHRDGVSARKACFFLDNAVVCLGAGITGTTGSIRTSIDQRLAEGTPATSRGPMTPGVNQCKAVSWVLNGAQGYLFPHPQDVFAGTQAQTGTWKNVYAAGSPAQITKDIFSIWINHDPGNGAYGYTMIPAANVAKLQAFVTHPPAEIVSNTREVQAVRDNAAGVTEILFYKPAALNAGNLSISADHPCAILIRNGLIDLADPTQKAPSVTLTINGKRTSVPLPQGEKAGSAVRVTAT